MNKEEQSQLCMLLAKMRYDILKIMGEPTLSEINFKQYDELLTAINKVIVFSYIDGEDNND